MQSERNEQGDREKEDLQKELIRNFSALLADFDYKYEMKIMGVGLWQWELRKRLRYELESLYIALWHLGLCHSFPGEHERVLSAFLASHTGRTSGNDAKKVCEHVMQYVDMLTEQGDADFSGVARHLLSLLEFDERAQKALNLKIALQLRHIYRYIFDRIV